MSNKPVKAGDPVTIGNLSDAIQILQNAVKVLDPVSVAKIMVDQKFDEDYILAVSMAGTMADEVIRINFNKVTVDTKEIG